MDGWMDGWMDGRMDRWMGEWMGWREGGREGGMHYAIYCTILNYVMLCVVSFCLFFLITLCFGFKLILHYIALYYNVSSYIILYYIKIYII